MSIINFSKKKKRKSREGFTILGVMWSLGIITIGLMGVSSLVLQNLQVQYINKNDLVASMLAQEGLELVRNQRDNNFLLGNTWTTNIIQDGNYAIDVVGDNIVFNQAPNAINSNGTELYYDQNNHKYTHDSSGNTSTVFRRLITVDDHSSSGNYVAISSNVQWTEKGRTRVYQADTNLYNWW